MIAKDNVQIKITLPKEMVEIMEKSIKEDKSGHRVTKSDIIITALAMLFGLAQERAKQQDQKGEC